MAKIKVHELAKEVSVESKEIIKRLQKMGVDAKTHMSVISEKDANAIRAAYSQNGAGPEGFSPQVKRIPKAVIQQEQAALAVERGETPEPTQAPLASEKPELKAEPTKQPRAEKAPQESATSQAAPGALQSEPVAEQKAPPVEAAAPAKPEKEKEAAEKAPEATTQPQAKEEKPPTALEETVSGTPLPQSAPEEPKPATPEKQARPQGQRDASRPQGQRDASRPQGQRDASRPQGQRDASRPQGQRDASRPQGQRDASRPQGQRDASRPQGQRDASRPQGQRDATRPQGQRDATRPQGQRDASRPQGQRDAGRPQGQRDASRPQGQRDAGRDNKAPAAAKEREFTPAAKPSSNYRPNNRKVFIKDVVFEKASEAETRSKSFNKNKFGKNTKGKNAKGRKEAPKMAMPPVTPKKITIGETVVLGELAKTMGKSAGEVIKKLFGMGIMATINQELDADTAILLAEEFGVTVEVRADRAAEIMEDIADDEGNMVERPPVVTIMGHVDHGKTSLLDAIRHTNVVSGEAGGITQHIGAYQVEIKGKRITFLDTPGHEAFTAMRARGANMTDIAIIVVAADDGVMPQTVEAINHSKAAGVPIIIAINKIDKPGANLDRVKQELTEYGLVAEDWGGDTIMVPVSAKARQNLEGLLEMILLVSEVAELKANPDRVARGVIVEAKLDKSRGPVATLLVQKGTLHAGDNIFAGSVSGKIRAMFDDKGRKVKAAGLSSPIEVLGFSEVPPAGETFIVVEDEKDARMVAAKLQIKQREESMRKNVRVSLEDLFDQIAQGNIKDLNLVVKADVQGSVEALTQSLAKLNTDEVRVNVIHAGVGGVSESDVMLAAASNAIIIGFNIIAPPAARQAAENDEVDIRLYRVIYDCLEDIKKAMGGLLAPEHKEKIIGTAEVRQVIRVPKVGTIAGSYVTSGKIQRNALVRIIRDNKIIADDKIDSLRRFKDDAKEVMQGFECGIGLESFNDIKEGDGMEVYVIEEVARELK